MATVTVGLNWFTVLAIVVLFVAATTWIIFRWRIDRRETHRLKKELEEMEKRKKLQQ